MLDGTTTWVAISYPTGYYVDTPIAITFDKIIFTKS